MLTIHTLLIATVVTFAAPGLRGDEAFAAAGVANATVPAAALALQDDAEGTYRKGREALARQDYRAAADLFNQVTRRWPRATQVPDALYWRAFALHRLGGEDDLREARTSLETMLRTYPRARASSDAKALAARIDGALARLGDPDATVRVGEIA